MRLFEAPCFRLPPVITASEMSKAKAGAGALVKAKAKAKRKAAAKAKAGAGEYPKPRPFDETLEEFLKGDPVEVSDSETDGEEDDGEETEDLGSGVQKKPWRAGALQSGSAPRAPGSPPARRIERAPPAAAR